MLLLLPYAIQSIGSCNGNLLLNAPYALFLLGSQVKTSVQGVRAAPVDFNKLLLIENLLFGNEAGADGEVLLGTCIIFLKVIAWLRPVRSKLQSHVTNWTPSRVGWAASTAPLKSASRR